MVPGVGVEPTRKYKFRGILSPLCLPISPPGHQVDFSKVCITSFEVVPGVGVEPTRKYKFRGILSPLCLPISPPGQTLVWRLVPESNLTVRICNPLYNRFTNAPSLGAGNEVRTRDPNHGKVMLYQLSYSRIRCVPLYRLFLRCQQNILKFF